MKGTRTIDTESTKSKTLNQYSPPLNERIVEMEPKNNIGLPSRNIEKKRQYSPFVGADSSCNIQLVNIANKKIGKFHPNFYCGGIIVFRRKNFSVDGEALLIQAQNI